MADHWEGSRNPHTILMKKPRESQIPRLGDSGMDGLQNQKFRVTFAVSARGVT